MTDARTNTVTTTTYHPGDLPHEVDHGGMVTEYVSYNAQGQPTGEILPGGATIIRSYTPMGELHTVSSTGTYPVSYTYDPQGRQRTMTTATGITTWAYHPQRGWLASKTDAANKAVAYTYTPGGLLHTRLWARGVSTTYGYDVAGELESVSYSDGTPGHTLERDLRGRVTEVSDGTGTRTFAHTTEGLLESESFISGLFAGMETVYNYDSLLRRDELLLNQGATTLALTSYGYDAASRLEEVMSGDLEVVYSRLANSSLLDDTTYEMSSTPVMTVSRSYDALNRLTGIGATPGVGPARSVGYQFDSAGRRERATREDDSYWQYGYNTRNEVTSGVKHWSDDSVVPGMTVMADIITGEKTVLQYLLKPVRSAMATAFTEK